jgi:hypothetical protein
MVPDEQIFIFPESPLFASTREQSGITASCKRAFGKKFSSELQNFYLVPIDGIGLLEATTRL